ncbi:hypothetical protein ACMD2_24057, partial [Ananas comosus]
MGEQELFDPVRHDQEKSYTDYLSGDSSSRSTNSKKQFSAKVASSSTLQTSVASIPRPSVKAANSASLKRRNVSENTLAQSVPNFSDFRKENTKPSIGVNRITTRTQLRNFSRSKSIVEETNSVLKEEKSQRSQSMRQSTAVSSELKDLLPLNDDKGALVNKVQKSGSKSFLKKGNGINPGAAGYTASMVSDASQNGEDWEEVGCLQEDTPDIIKDEELERTSSEENPRDFQADSDSEKARLSQEYGNTDDLGSENDDTFVMNVSSAAATAASKFGTFAGNVQDSPTESPRSWNPHNFSYTHETSDFDASIDSATGSPISWNSHPLNQMMEADAARTRKKWGSAQMPSMLSTNPSQQPRKDVTKGFKRLLKFGRKSRGADILVNDWVSASTASEGDDDVDDGRDEPRKSRMGYPPLSSYDGFNECEIFSEQAQSLRSSIPNPPANFKLREDHLTGSSLK